MDQRTENEAVQRARRAAPETDPLGPGTAGHTTSGAAYRGQEVAGNTGSPAPAEPGFTQSTGLGYNDGGVSYNDYGPAERSGK